MNTKKKKIFGASLLALSLLTLGACGNDKKEATEDFSIKDRYELDPSTPAWKLDTKEDNKLTWYINADWLQLEFGEDMTTAKIKEDLNLDVDIVTGDDTKLNTMFAGGDMPDIITLTDSTSSTAKKAETWAYPLTDLAEKYDPYFNEVAKEQTMNWFQLEDGKTYGYPNFSNTTEDYEDGIMPVNTDFIIRSDVYEDLGKPSIGTPEEFRDVMQQINDKYPELEPFGFNPVGNDIGSLGDVLQDFIGVPLEDENGEFYNRNLDEDYLTWVRTINQVYRDGNISDDSFSDDGPTFDEKIKSGKYATLFVNGVSGFGGHLQTFMNSNPGVEYIAIDGPQSTEGNQIKLNQTGLSGWMVNYITKDSTDPAKAIQLFTYLLSDEGQILTKYGIEGETFEYNEDGLIEMLPEITKLKEEKPEEYSKKYRLSEILFFNHDRANTLKVPDEKGPLTQLQEWGKGKLYPHYVIENVNPDQGTAEARSYDAIKTNWHTSLISMIRSKSEKDFDTNLAAYEKFLDDNNWDDIVKIQNEKMATNKEKLKLSEE